MALKALCDENSVSSIFSNYFSVAIKISILSIEVTIDVVEEKVVMKARSYHKLHYVAVHIDHVPLR